MPSVPPTPATLTREGGVEGRMNLPFHPEKDRKSIILGIF